MSKKYRIKQYDIIDLLGIWGYIKKYVFKLNIYSKNCMSRKVQCVLDDKDIHGKYSPIFLTVRYRQWKNLPFKIRFESTRDTRVKCMQSIGNCKTHPNVRIL